MAQKFPLPDHFCPLLIIGPVSTQAVYITAKLAESGNWSDCELFFSLVRLSVKEEGYFPMDNAHGLSCLSSAAWVNASVSFK